MRISLFQRIKPSEKKGSKISVIGVLTIAANDKIASENIGVFFFKRDVIGKKFNRPLDRGISGPRKTHFIGRTLGFALEAQRLKWVAPYHEGAVRYFKEKKVWTAELERYNQQLVRRQEVLGKAWDRAQDEAQKQKLGTAKFPELWMKIRTEELKQAGFDPYWETKFW